MQRWQMLLMLTAGVVAAAVLSPTLQGATDGERPVAAAPPSAWPLVALPAADEGPLRVDARLDSAFSLLGVDADRYLVVEITAPDAASVVRQPVHLSLVVDGSGSMKATGKISYARAAAGALVERMGVGDSLSLVRFADAAVALAPQGGLGQRRLLREQIRGLTARGGTNIYAGLQAGRTQLRAAPRSGVRRVVLLSDGYATAGPTGAGSLLALAQASARDGVGLSALGLGLDFNEDLMAGLADAGGGRYHYVDDPMRLAQQVTEELSVASALSGQALRLDLDLHGARALEVYGFSAERTGVEGQLSVPLGDLHGGETRRLVIRLDVPEGRLGEQTVADLTVRYASPEGRAHAVSRTIRTLVTSDADVVEASLDRVVEAQAARARSGALINEGAEAFAQGDLLTNQARLAEAVALLSAASASVGDAALAEEAAVVEAQRQTFSAAPAASPAAQDVMKKSKEVARDYSR